MTTDTPKINIAALSKTQLFEAITNLGEPKFRADQVFQWIWKKRVFDFDGMSNVSVQLRNKLKEGYEIRVPRVITAQKSSDGTVKYLHALADNRTVETVWIPREDQGRVTVCISSQVGCKMGCTFCLTAQQKVERNLAAGEIAGQLLVMPDFDQITNVVLMGMGEPLDNYDNVMGSLELMGDKDSLNIGSRKITVSTSGLVPAIKKFVASSKCRLAISLNAPNDVIRNEIMPINRAYPLDVLLGTLKELAHKPDLRAQKKDFWITFEYILIDQLNDGTEHAMELVKRVRGIPCKINLLLYNENPNVPYKRPQPDRVDRFREVLMNNGVLNFVRSSRGRDISAACGQLASEHKRKPTTSSEPTVSA